ncbi:MAG: M28 family peptidase, partial [Gemmatimonadota bacterium]
MRAALLCAAALLVPALASSGRAQDAPGEAPAARITGAAVAGETGAKGASVDALERLLISVIQPDSVARWARGLAARSHVAGTPGQRATRDSILAWMSAAGLTVAYDSLEIYLPQPLETELRQTAPTTHRFDLTEPALGSRDYEHVPAFNAYGAGGVAEGILVYANFGLPEDYEQLAALGIDVTGRIVLARYGRSFRGIKAREAEIRGAAGLLLFSDPSADGFTLGTVLPEGPYRPERGLQRGSVLNSNGDPSTPGRPSLPGAARVPEAEMEGIARIPVLPIGYGAAARLLAPLGGPPAPDGWAGGLDVSYRPGPGPTTVRMTVRMETGEAAYHPAFNTIAALPGAVWPDEWIIIGAHRDAWGPGAVDNVSGTASVVEVARAFARAARDGLRPRRTIVFATWDAEEWGILGSTEWVEANEERLTRSAVAYINQ